jgi:hypothetical protein
VRLFSLLFVGFLSACGGGGNDGTAPPPSRALTYTGEAFLNTPGGEGTPVVFNGRLLVVEGTRVGVPAQRIEVWDGVTRVQIADFEAPEGMTLICAIVVDDRLYVFGVTNFNMAAGLSAYGNRVVMISTANLLAWTPAQTVYTFPTHVAGYNLSVTPAPGGYVMAYDFGPPWQQGFLRSTDLVQWEELPGYFQMPPWSSAVTLRYLDGLYYLFYSTQDSAGNYYTGAARSTDLFGWEHAGAAAMYPSSPLARINTTDFDLVELDGYLFVNFAYGDQSGNGGMATATYPGTFPDMVKDLFTQ